MIIKDFKNNLKVVVNKYLKEEYSKSLECFDDLVTKFKGETLDAEQEYQLKKFMMVFFWVIWSIYQRFNPS